MQLDNVTLKRIALLLAGGIGLFWLLQNTKLVGSFLGFLWGIIFPFILGGIIAFLFNLPVRAIETKVFRGRHFRGSRILSFLITVVLLLGLLSLLVFLLVPQLAKTITMLASDMPGYISRIQANLAPFEKYIPELQQFLQKLDWSKVGSTLFSWLQTGFGGIFSSAIGVATSVISGATSFFIALIFSAYIIFDKEHVSAQLSSVLQAYIPQKRFQQMMDILRLTNRTFSRFVTGQCAEALAIGTVYVIALSIGQFDYALLIGVIIAFSSFIPLLGAFIGCVLGALLLWVSMGMWRALVFVILFLVIQQLDGNFMYPRIVGTSIGLPPMWVLVAISVGGGLMGVFGMLFFIPLTSVVYVLVSRNTAERLKSKGIASPMEHYYENKPKKPKKEKKMK